MNTRKILGIDLVDFAVQVAATICGVGLLVGSPGMRDEVAIFGVTGVSLLIFAIRRARALRRGAGEATGEEFFAGRALEEQGAHIVALEGRIYELEERLEFAERVLTQARAEPQRVGQGADHA